MFTRAAMTRYNKRCMCFKICASTSLENKNTKSQDGNKVLHLWFRLKILSSIHKKNVCKFPTKWIKLKIILWIYLLNSKYHTNKHRPRYILKFSKFIIDSLLPNIFYISITLLLLQFVIEIDGLLASR